MRRGLVGALLAIAALVVAAPGWTYTPGAQIDYVENTSNTVLSTTPTTVVTADSETFDGSTRINIEFFATEVSPTSGAYVDVFLYDGSTELGALAEDGAVGTAGTGVGIDVNRYLIPTAGAHVYSIRASKSGGTGTIYAGNGVSGAYMPAYIRISDADAPSAPGCSTLACLSDVTGSPSTGQVLTYGGSSWSPATPSTGGCTTLACLTDVNTAGKSDGNYLGWSTSSGKWVPLAETSASELAFRSELLSNTGNGAQMGMWGVGALVFPCVCPVPASAV